MKKIFFFSTNMSVNKKPAPAQGAETLPRYSFFAEASAFSVGPAIGPDGPELAGHRPAQLVIIVQVVLLGLPLLPQPGLKLSPLRTALMAAFTIG